jgi:hypothetical protein
LKLDIDGVLDLVDGTAGYRKLWAAPPLLGKVKKIAFDVRFTGGKPEAFPGIAADLVRREVDVILAPGPAAIRAARLPGSWIMRSKPQ